MGLQHACHEPGQMIGHRFRKLCRQLHQNLHGGSEAVHPDMTVWAQRPAGPLALLSPPSNISLVPEAAGEGEAQKHLHHISAGLLVHLSSLTCVQVVQNAAALNWSR